VLKKSLYFRKKESPPIEVLDSSEEEDVQVVGVVSKPAIRGNYISTSQKITWSRDLILEIIGVKKLECSHP
jgi:hypothetical protein